MFLLPHSSTNVSSLLWHTKCEKVNNCESLQIGMIHMTLCFVYHAGEWIPIWLMFVLLLLNKIRNKTVDNDQKWENHFEEKWDSASLRQELRIVTQAKKLFSK